MYIFLHLFKAIYSKQLVRLQKLSNDNVTLEKLNLRWLFENNNTMEDIEYSYCHFKLFNVNISKDVMTRSHESALSSK